MIISPPSRPAEYFISPLAAYRHFRRFGFGVMDLAAMMRDGRLKIGRPPWPASPDLSGRYVRPGCN